MWVQFCFGYLSAVKHSKTASGEGPEEASMDPHRGKCRTCRHWEQYDDDVPAGECYRVGRQDQGTSPYPYIDLDPVGVVDVAVLVTAADFGCTEWGTK